MRALVLLGTAIVTVVLLFLIGPRAELDETPRDFELPQDLDAHLVASEAGFGDIVPGTEKRIVWAGPDRERTPFAIVYLHGFSATHRDTAPLAEIVARHLGANLYLSRLAGHGRGSEPMGEVEAADWLHDAREAWAIGERLGERVVLMGHSTGATLCVWLAMQDAGPELDALVLLSPNFAPADRAAELLTWPWGGWIARAIQGPEREWEPANERHGRYFTTRYPTRALLPMMALVEGTRTLRLEMLQVPTLVFFNPADTVVDAAETQRTFDRLPGPKELVPVSETDDPEGHVLAGDILAPDQTNQVAARVIAFLTVQ
jgi:alpha-beta hydrolase superfamily lysophospholipase